ncbi:hypothetical protein D3C86_1773430 [compost metagenome]
MEISVFIEVSVQRQFVVKFSVSKAVIGKKIDFFVSVIDAETVVVLHIFSGSEGSGKTAVGSFSLVLF